MSSTLSSIRVTSQTTLEQLKSFQETIGQDDAKLRGSVNRDGSITLKAVNCDSSRLAKFFGIAKKRNDAARSALTMVMTNSGAADRKPMGSLTGMINGSRTTAPGATMLKDMIAFVEKNNSNSTEKVSEFGVKPPKQETELLKREYPKLADKGLQTTDLKHFLMLARDFANHAPLSDRWVGEFSDEIVKNVLTQLTGGGPLGLNEAAMLGVSDIEGFVKELADVAMPPPRSDQVNEGLKKIGEAVAAKLAESLLGGKQIDDDSFQLGGETFRKVEVLGEGGFGRAELYRSETTGKEVVLKVPAAPMENADPVDIAKAKFNFKAEIDMHTKLMAQMQGEGPVTRHDNIVSFEGAIRLPNGLFATVTEACTGGNMAQMMGKIDTAVRDGLMTPQQGMACRLTLMRDMIDGQNAVFGRGFSHRDVKFQNVFVDANGVGKVADFGETSLGTIFSLSQEKIIENPLYLAAENLVARDQIDKLGRKVVECKVAHFKAKLEVYNSLVGPGGAFEGLNLGVENASKFAPPAEDLFLAGFNTWARQAEEVMQRVDSKLQNLGETGQLLQSIINDLTKDEGERLETAANNYNRFLPIATLVDGGAADVWSFGSAILNTFIRPGEAISSLPQWEAGVKLAEYSADKGTDPGNGAPLIPPRDPLMPGGFLTDRWVSQHQNGTVTGDPDLDALVSSTLQRDPNDRPSFGELRENPLFRRPGVGDDKTREMIAALGGKPPKTNDEIRQLAAQMTA